MGAANSPSAFSRLMNLILRGLVWQTCLIYIDDTIVVSRSFDEHVKRLDEVLQRFHAAHLKLKPEKCRLFQLRVKFLGHIVSNQGVEVDPEKVSAIKNLPTPRNLKDVRATLGFVNYYRAHCANYSHITEPFNAMLRKEPALFGVLLKRRHSKSSKERFLQHQF
jgi:hypothetical protein